jgi:choline-phosphate cytidylyltransferase
VSAQLASLQGKAVFHLRFYAYSNTYRIVRDYEKYIARQFKRGTSRQELNVSWLKKNELDLKRHVQDLRENITNNWSTTGQELGRELKQFWPVSRPQSPARFNSAGTAEGLRSEGLRSPTTPGTSGTPKEFITGYALGLVGGVRGWVSRDLILNLWPD